jgi:hypothetical protein
MALVSAADIQHSLIPETTFGTTPTTGATRYLLPLAPDAPLLTAKATQIASPTRMPNRANNGSKRGMTTVEGSLDLRFQKAPVLDKLLESAVSGAFATNVLKAAMTDSSFSVLSFMQGGAAGAQMIKAYNGCMVNGFTISSKGNDAVSAAFQVMGAGYSNLTTDNALTTTTTAYSEFVAADLQAITLAGVPISVAEVSLDWKVDRTRRPVVSSNTGLAFGVNGTTEVTLTIKAYRDSFSVDTAITGAAQAVSFSIGGVGTGYSFSLPAAYGEIPSDEISDGSAFVNITFSGAYDATQGTNLVITKL